MTATVLAAAATAAV